MSIEFHRLDSSGMEQFLARRRFNPNLILEMGLAENLVAILRKANEFVPSAAGSILLDHPAEKDQGRRAAELTFIAAFGDQLRGPGRPAHHRRPRHRRPRLPERRRLPRPRRARRRLLRSGVDEETQYRTESLLAVPIRIGNDVCGVLELINRQGGARFNDRDRNLLEIFADYISISIQNVLDGRQAHEIAKRDNLTGLFNDRYLHIALDACIESLPRRRQGPGGAVPRPRLLQARQRHPWSPGRQPGAARGRGHCCATTPPATSRPGSPPATAATSSCWRCPAPASTAAVALAEEIRNGILEPHVLRGTRRDPARAAPPVGAHLLDRRRQPQAPRAARRPARPMQEHAPAAGRRRHVRGQGDRTQSDRGRRQAGSPERGVPRPRASAAVGAGLIG